MPLTDIIWLQFPWLLIAKTIFLTKHRNRQGFKVSVLAATRVTFRLFFLSAVHSIRICYLYNLDLVDWLQCLSRSKTSYNPPPPPTQTLEFLPAKPSKLTPSTPFHPRLYTLPNMPTNPIRQLNLLIAPLISNIERELHRGQRYLRFIFKDCVNINGSMVTTNNNQIKGNAIQHIVSYISHQVNIDG